jgi:L-lactate dehydrogenase
VTESFVSALHWVNRSETVFGHVFDLKHGLAFAPTCHEVFGYQQPQARQAVSRSELVIVTHGVGVTDGDRASLYPQNRRLMRETVIEALRGFEGVVLLVSNPVELLARLVLREASLRPEQVIALGTLVETARARAALADHISPARPARDIPIVALGTHDSYVVMQLDGDQGLDQRDSERILARVHREVVNGASRVKDYANATQHPVVEATMAVARAVGNDSRALLTVATRDPGDADGLFNSVPCIVGRDGVCERRDEVVRERTRMTLRAGKEAMRAVLQRHPDDSIP